MGLPDHSRDFSIRPEAIWLNVASEGPVPNAAKLALEEAVRLKLSPDLLTIPKFQEVPLRLKESLAQLVHVDQQDIILGNSATYGLHLLANGLRFQEGDEIIVLQNDFPTDILPWLSLQDKGIIVSQLKAKEHVLTLAEITQAVSKHTRLVCLPYIHSFTGHRHDIAAIGEWCRTKGILFVVNLSQAAGVIDIDLAQLDIDAIVCAGYKWLLGPYGTGFCWMKKQVRERLNYPQNYWISLMNEKTLNGYGPLELIDDHSTRRYDIFATANFFNYMPWQASIDYLLSKGVPAIERHNKCLVDIMADGIDAGNYELISPKPKQKRTNIIVFSFKDPSQNQSLYEFLKTKNFFLALWKNKLRVSPHIYNTPAQIEQLLAALNEYAA